jgi:catabolite repression protein CreC
MENDSTFVAPEGVYSVTEDLKPSPTYAAPANLHQYPTKLSSVVVTFPAPKQPAPGFAQLLGGSKENKKEKDKDKDKDKDKLLPKEDGVSLSSSDTPDEGSADQSTPGPPDNSPMSPSIPHLFSQSHAPRKKKSVSRPKHNIRTTSSTFITRLHSAEGLSKILQSKHGETTFLFYNLSKNFIWIDTSSKSKVRTPSIHTLNDHTSDASIRNLWLEFLFRLSQRAMMLIH